MTSRITEIINSYPPLAFTSHPALIAELEAYHAGLVTALAEIAAPHACGCRPCVGQCESQEALKIIVDEMRDTARVALKAVCEEGKEMTDMAADAFATAETVRAELIAQVGECCGGADPVCIGAGCRVEIALRKRASAQVRPPQT